MQTAAESRFFRSVEPLPDYKLLVGTLPGERIIFDFSARMHTTRYGDLRNIALFNSVCTDGKKLIFQLSGLIFVTVSAGKFFQLLATDPHKQQSDITEEELK